ncbi:MAG: hypothetical protein ACE5HU_08600 [Acidobacteriota bacterium]
MGDDQAERVHLDHQGYYRLLRLDTDATAEEIQLAFEMLGEWSDEMRGAPMAQIERAYRALINPASRRTYDLVCTAPSQQAEPRRGRLDDWRVLAACLVVFLGIILFVWAPMLTTRFKSFSPGDHLLDQADQPFGVVVKSSDLHTFSANISSEAYLIRLDGSGDSRWFPAKEIRATFHRAD